MVTAICIDCCRGVQPAFPLSQLSELRHVTKMATGKPTDALLLAAMHAAVPSIAALRSYSSPQRQPGGLVGAGRRLYAAQVTPESCIRVCCPLLPVLSMDLYTEHADLTWLHLRVL